MVLLRSPRASSCGLKRPGLCFGREAYLSNFFIMNKKFSRRTNRKWSNELSRAGRPMPVLDGNGFLLGTQMAPLGIIFFLV